MIPVVRLWGTATISATIGKKVRMQRVTYGQIRIIRRLDRPKIRSTSAVKSISTEFPPRSTASRASFMVKTSKDSIGKYTEEKTNEETVQKYVEPVWERKCSRWTAYGGRWTRDGGRRTMDQGRWTRDGGRWTRDGEQRTADQGRRTVYSRQRSRDGIRRTVENGPGTANGVRRTRDGRRSTAYGGWWTRDGGRWTADQGQRTVDQGRLTVDQGRWTADCVQRTADGVQRTVDQGRRTEDGRPGTADGGPVTSMQNRVLPSFFGMSTTGEAQGLFDGSITSCSTISLINWSTWSSWAYGTRLGACLIGCASPVSIACVTTVSFTPWFSTRLSFTLTSIFSFRFTINFPLFVALHNKNLKMSHTGEGQSTAGTSAAVQSKSVNFIPPPFWKANVPIWFGQVEAQFRMKGINDDDDRFDCVIGAIDSSVLAQVGDLITNPPALNKYDTLKTRLIGCFSDSEEKKLQKLLQETKLGDQRPSHLLREMRELANNRVSEEILKTLWLQRLPANVQGILSVSADPNLATLAILADKILEVCDPRNSVCVVNNELPIRNRSRSPNADIADKIEALTRRFDAARQAVCSSTT
ncbi:unnamed protein product [Nesidiocoris tenuis]|uniref:DUF7041 domain-containing protein n=1 Tax=Nesidiocoris tenuis TaxID=355587 RepID=A0A6H5HGP4_9HEMI|nr:unnamed protein product [Nesidiocoris tenuis]